MVAILAIATVHAQLNLFKKGSCQSGFRKSSGTDPREISLQLQTPHRRAGITGR